MINKLEQIQRSLVSRIGDNRIQSLFYWEKLRSLRLYSQEKRRERYMIIFEWKIFQQMGSGYTIPFRSCCSRTFLKLTSMIKMDKNIKQKNIPKKMVNRSKQQNIE